jgi:tetratricopeptide (TPR) repeat protein
MANSRMEMFRQALDQDPNNELARFSLARELFDEEEYGQALEHYQAALAAKPDWMRAHIQVCKCCLELGGMDQARSSLSRARDLMIQSGDLENQGEIDELAERLEQQENEI